jgi:hypothetical protein
VVAKAAEPIAPPTFPVAESPHLAAHARALAVAWQIPENAHPDQAIAVRRLMTLLRAKKIEMPSDPGAFGAGTSATVLAPIELKPIVIAPLPNGQGGGSER